MCRSHLLVAAIGLFLGCQAEPPPAKPVLANAGVERGDCASDFGMIPCTQELLPPEVCPAGLPSPVTDPPPLRNWPTQDGAPAGHHWVEVKQSPVGQVAFELPIPHTLTSILVHSSGQPFLASEQRIDTIPVEGTALRRVVEGAVLRSASLDEKERICWVDGAAKTSGSGTTSAELLCSDAAANSPGVDPPIPLDDNCVPSVRQRLYRSTTPSGVWVLTGADRICLRFDDGEWYARLGSTQFTSQNIIFLDRPTSAADCECPIARMVPGRGELAVAFEAHRWSGIGGPIVYGYRESGWPQDTQNRLCVRAPAMSGVRVSVASMFTPEGKELVCGSTCGGRLPGSPLPYFFCAGQPVEYAAWWHSLPDGTPMHLGLLLGAFGNDDLLTGVGRVNHKTGAAVWKWPSWLDPKAEDLKHAHVVLDSNDNVYIGLQRELVGFAKNGTVRWRLPLPDEAKVSAMGLSYAGVLWVGLNLPNGTARVWRVH